MAEFTCPNCGNPIYDEEALLCLYCGNSLRRKIGFMGRIKHVSPTMILAIAIGLVIFCFLALMIR